MTQPHNDKSEAPSSALHLLLEKNILPNVSIECVVFGYHNKELKVLCSRIEAMDVWSLPSGTIGKDEDLDDAVYRILEEQTGLQGLFLKQFNVAGDKNRSLANTGFPLVEQRLLDTPVGNDVKWIFTSRFISIHYYALTEFSKVSPRPGVFFSETSWVDIHNLPPLILHNKHTVLEALKTLRRQLQHEPIGLNLLPEKFTLPELQILYETILGKTLDPRNFTKKLMTLGILRKLAEKRAIGGHRSPFLYRFNKRAYVQALKEEVSLVF